MALYDPERVDKISQIMPRFSEHVQVGDEILLGLEGDPLYPEKYNDYRPKGVVTKVKQLDGGASIKVQMENGSKVTLAPGELDPQKVWEFSDDSFQKVLQRSIPQEQSNFESNDYRGSENVDFKSSSSDIQQLKQELAMLKSQYETDQIEARQFNNTLIATMNEVAQDVCASNPNAGFCNIFTGEYRSMFKGGDNSTTMKEDKMFDSDFSDSDSD